MKRILIILLLFLLFIPLVKAEESGVVSLNDARINQAVEEFTQKMIQHFLVKRCGEIMQDVILKQNLQIFPEIAWQAAQHSAIQVFKQQDLKDILVGIFDENTKRAKDEISLGMPQGFIELGIKKRVEQDVEILVEDPLFRYVIEVMMNQAMVQQQQILMMAVAQRQAQLMAIQQQQMLMQQQYLQAAMSQAR